MGLTGFTLWEAQMRFTGFREPQPEDRIQALLARWSAADEAPLGVWCVEERETDAFLGWCMLRHAADEDPELGFMFVSSQWRRGYATEVSIALLGYAFSTLGLGRVTAAVAAEHVDSIRVLKKIGMKAAATVGDSSSLLQFEVAASSFPVVPPEQRLSDPDDPTPPGLT